MQVSILTVTWNSVDYIIDQINSVRAAFHDVEFEHLIADNASTDGTVAAIRQKFPEQHLIANRENIGFGAACNQLAAAATGKYILLLNPDMKIEGSPDELVRFAEENLKIGIIGCKLLDSNGKLNRRTTPRKFPDLKSQLAILLKLHRFFPNLAKDYLMENFDGEVPQKVDSVQGSCLLVRREIYDKLGYLFDPRYYIWFEDVDLCAEARRLGFETWYLPAMACVDFGGRSFAKQPLFWKQKMFSGSMVRYFRKWSPGYAAVILTIVRPFVLAAAWVHDLFL